MKALVIENGPLTRHLLSELLFKLEVDTVIEFNQATPALEYIEEDYGERISCVFLDINIKSHTSTSFLDELMLHSIHKDIPIFILTDNHTTMAILEELNHDVCAYINKPFSIKQVRECLHMAKKFESYNLLLETHAS